MNTTISTYTKSIVALVGFLLTTAVALDWGFEFPQWVPALTSLVTALGVYLFKNAPYVEYGTSNAERDGLDGRDII